jgi:hypothetical protein
MAETPDPNGHEEPLYFGPTDPEIKAMREKYAKALQEEFSKEDEENQALAGLEDPVSNVEKYTRQFFRQNLPDAAAQIVWLSANSTSDSIRLRASTFIVKEALEDARAEGDPIKDLLQSLALTPTAPAESDV